MKSTIYKSNPKEFSDYSIINNDVLPFLKNYKKNNSDKFKLIVTSPPYNIGKEYENKMDLDEYKNWQKSIIQELIPLLHDEGSICWQIGNHVFKNNGNSKEILPLDFLFHNIFDDLELQLRNRIVWTFGHGLHSRKRFSGRYEVILWYTKNNNYTFNLDSVRIDSKYPSKKYYKGPNKGEYSSNPKGKNPSDVWDNIPNVKSNHVEKTNHPCQFPVGLVERLIKGLTHKGDLVFDPFAGVSTTGVACALFDRKYIGCEIDKKYCKIGKERIDGIFNNKTKYRPHYKELYDYKKSNLSKKPEKIQ